MNSISIVIPHHNHWELTHKLLWDLYKLERSNIFEVVLVDDASDESGLITGEKWWKDNGMLPIRVIRFDENVGFINAANKGLRRSIGDIRVLISNDVQFQTLFLQQVIDLLESDPEQLIGNVFYPTSTGWNTFGERTFPYLSGHFLCATCDIWEKLEYFDPRYCPNDFEDVDLSTKALSMGIRLTSLALPGIIHLGGQTIGYSPEREAITITNKEKFRQKWMGNE